MGMNQEAMSHGGESKKRELEPGEFKPVAGRTYRLRVLPRDMKEYLSPQGAADFCFMYRYHFKYTKQDGSVVYNIPCPKTFGMDRACRVCKESWELYNSANEEDKKLSKDFKRNDQALINLVDLTDEAGVAKGAQWWRSPFTKVYQEIRKFVVNPQWAVNGKDILDLEVGRNFSVRVLSEKESGTGFQDYEIMPEPTSFDVRPYLVGDWEAKVNSLVDRRPKVTPEEVEALIAVGPGRTAGPAAAPPPPGGNFGGKPAEPGAASNEQHLKAPPPPPPPGAASAPRTASAPPPPATPAAPPPPAAPAAPPPPAAPAAPPSEPVREAASAEGDPACFGKDYSLKNQRCVKCKAADPDLASKCRNKYLA